MLVVLETNPWTNRVLTAFGLQRLSSSYNNEELLIKKTKNKTKTETKKQKNKTKTKQKQKQQNNKKQQQQKCELFIAKYV